MSPPPDVDEDVDVDGLLTILLVFAGSDELSLFVQEVVNIIVTHTIGNSHFMLLNFCGMSFAFCHPKSGVAHMRIHPPK